MKHVFFSCQAVYSFIFAQVMVDLFGLHNLPFWSNCLTVMLFCFVSFLPFFLGIMFEGYIKKCVVDKKYEEQKIKFKNIADTLCNTVVTTLGDQTDIKPFLVELQMITNCNEKQALQAVNFCRQCSTNSTHSLSTMFTYFLLLIKRGFDLNEVQHIITRQLHLTNDN